MARPTKICTWNFATRPQPITATLAILFALALVTVPAQAQTETVLHTFEDGLDSGLPYGGLTIDRAGNLYGTAYWGFECMGLEECYGLVFKLSNRGQGWTFTPLYAFPGGGSGENPFAGVTIGPDGALYGTTVNGGAYKRGTVFRVTPAASLCRNITCPWVATTLHSFGGSNDGVYPYSGVTFDAAGNLYGTTVGGPSGPGAVFKLTPSGDSWTETVLWSFNGSDGADPYGNLVLDSAGNIYGTTLEGGYSGCFYGTCGTVFELQSKGGYWAETVLHYFQGGADGDEPYAGLTFDNSGNLFGVTSSDGPIGGGTVFELTPANGGWTYSVAYGLPGVTSSDMPNPGPRGNLVVDSAGNLYGTTIENGTQNEGTVFVLTPSYGSYTYTALYNFCSIHGCPDGGWPWAGVVRDSYGNLYGATIAGGYEQGNCRVGGCGVVFEITQ
jgi:uncharacterized repeat protein (TIGR03803 family)